MAAITGIKDFKNTHMQKTLAIVKMVILVIILAFLFMLNAVTEQKTEKEKGKSDSAVFKSDVIDVSKQGQHIISLNSDSWPALADLKNEILVINLVLQQSNEYSCENDFHKSSLILRVAAHSIEPDGIYSRLFFSDVIPCDTILLSAISSVGNTGIHGYTFAFPIGNLSCLQNDDISIELEIIQEDSLVNHLKPLITVKPYSEIYSHDIQLGGLFRGLFFFSIVILVFIFIVFEIVYLFGDKVVPEHKE